MVTAWEQSVRYGALGWPEPEYPEPGLLTIAGVMLDTGQVQDMSHGLNY